MATSCARGGAKRRARSSGILARCLSRLTHTIL
jgi:hypothetical protein